ncbi:MAG: type II toxin-antitoxin system RelE/ParE family toxin [Candidatus Contendobacter sp.]|nr:type II toxin-antitoxin system RelE/ParE family toxin [Candidatus Contendobacter sp.]
MAWAVELAASAADALDKLDPATQQRIWRYLRGRLARTDNPRQSGKALTGPYAGLWRYRVGDYRLICRIEDARLVVLVVKIGNRRNVYKGTPQP